MERIALVNPPMVGLRGDVLGSNVPYMPVQLAYLASYLESRGYEAVVIDGFGLSPKTRTAYKERYEVAGIGVRGTVARVPYDCVIACIYAGLVTNHSLVLGIVKELKNRGAKVLVFENSLAVTGYSLKETKDAFFEAGTDYLVFGEPEERVCAVIESIENGKQPKTDGIAYRTGKKTVVRGSEKHIDDPDSLPFPAYDHLPLGNYWALGNSHGPFTGKFVPLITSRGCPYDCNFCVVPSTNRRRWRARSAGNVVDEMEYWMKKLGIRDFQIEDLNPTMDKKRNMEICREIVKRNLRITWKIAAGTKAESLDEETLDRMKDAGCVYLSISPESGSKRVLKLMNKPFDHEHGLRIVEHCSKIGITTQCCFVIGYPGEKEEDLKLTKEYVSKLAKAGADEIAVFIMAPLPGSRVFEQYDIKDLDKLDFTSEWREDYPSFARWRKEFYKRFLLKRALHHPIKLASDGLGIIRGRYKTKMSMAVRRFLSIRR